jgi:hypothetical protein
MTQLQFPPSRGPDPMEIAIAMVMVLSSLGGLTLLFMVVRAWTKRIGQPKADSGELAELREEVLGELQHVRQEVSELSERVDFAERLLAKQREAGRLPQGG